MKKTILTSLLLFAGLLVWSQTRKPSSQEVPKQEQKDNIPAKAADTDFQSKKAQEAREKQEARRKAMKERAKSKQEIEKSH